MPAPGDGSEDPAETAPQPQNQEQDNFRYAAGTAAAATPTPTPATTPNEPPVKTDTRRDPPVTPRPAEQIEYAEPVDPWAEAEAQARAAGAPPPYSMDPPASPAPPGGSAYHPAGPPTYLQAGPGTGKTSYRKSFWILGGAALAAVVALGVTAVVLLRPDFPALGYHNVEEVARLTPAATITSSWAASGVFGDRVYFAGNDQQGTAAVTAYDLDAGKEVWKNTNAGAARSWNYMLALPGAVVLVSDADYTTSKARLVVLDGKTGAKRWEYALGSSDSVHFGSGVVLVVDREHGVLHGLALATGVERWQAANADGSTSSGVIDVTTPADLTGPADTQGWPFAPELSDDDQVVQIAADRSARVIDLNTGKIGKPRPDVAYTSDKMVAHNGRLFVEESSSRRLLAYDLKSFDTGEPAVVYTAPKDASVTDLTPCGDDRICFVETVGYAGDKATVVAYDLVARKEVWREPAPDVETLVPVGDAVLAATDDSTTLFDVNGKPLWSKAPGAAARLDAGNVLRFSDRMSTSVRNQGLEGVHPGDKPVALGTVHDVRSGSCSWNTAVLACVTENDFLIERFAD
jgi:outer membrane protein assembly factor BamB